MNILAGDIGGTNARLALYQSDGDDLRQVRSEVFSSGEFRSLESVIEMFLKGAPSPVDAVCLGLPGPIGSGDEVRLTNLPWLVRRADIARSVGTDRVLLVNDVEATAAAVPSLGPDQLRCLQAGAPDPSGNRAVVSVGTGLGVGGLSPSGRAFATEGGHATFAPRSDFDIRLKQSLEKDFGHCSWERVASGPALSMIYASTIGAEVAAPEPAEIVARSGADPACRRTVEIFLGYLGSVAGNIALTLMATGGVFFAGGVAPHVISAAGAETMLKAFQDKGRMRPVLERIPVFLILEPDAALLGAASSARVRWS